MAFPDILLGHGPARLKAPTLTGRQRISRPALAGQSVLDLHLFQGRRAFVLRRDVVADRLAQRVAASVCRTARDLLGQRQMSERIHLILRPEFLSGAVEVSGYMVRIASVRDVLRRHDMHRLRRHGSTRLHVFEDRFALDHNAVLLDQADRPGAVIDVGHLNPEHDLLARLVRLAVMGLCYHQPRIHAIVRYPQHSQNITHRIVALACFSGWCDRIRADDFAFFTTQRISDSIVIQRSAYCCRQLRISGSIGLALVVRCDGHCLRRYLQRDSCLCRFIVCILGFDVDCLLANILDARSFRRPLAVIPYLVGNRCAFRDACTCGCGVCISIVFAFVSGCRQCHLSGLADRQGSRNITHLELFTARR